MVDPSIHEKGQYFTSNDFLRETIFNLIRNNPSRILEPCVGRGDLVYYTNCVVPDIQYDCYEIDGDINFLEVVGEENVNLTICDFLQQEISEKYDTIIGNPPFVKTKSGNLYIEFIDKCVNLLNENGELIFIVPSDFLKLTSSRNIINKMLVEGAITDIIHPHNERLFEDAAIDVVVFRYCRNCHTDKTRYNGVMKYCINSNGIITFKDTPSSGLVELGSYFDIHVGLVSGKDSVFKNAELGNVEVLTSENTMNPYIIAETFPTADTELNKYLVENKKELLNRRIRKFNEDNWWEWGALRNYETIKAKEGRDCIYVSNITRHEKVCFRGSVSLFGGNLIIMIPKKKVNLDKVVSLVNSDEFKSNYLYSGRFKIGQKHLCSALVKPTDVE